MDLADSGAEWLEVERRDAGADRSWRVDARLNGTHYKMADAFETKEAAQGCALLLAMRQVPGRRDALDAQLDAIPGAWWWRITQGDDTGAERRFICSSRVCASPEAAERSGRAMGAAGSLHVYGPGVARALGPLPK